MKKRLTDEQATRAQKIIDDYNKKYHESIRNLAKHRVPCDEGESISLAGRELNVKDNEIEFPPYGQSFLINLKNYLKIKTDKTDITGIGESSKDNNRGKE